jgi:hypothetical protein
MATSSIEPAAKQRLIQHMNKDHKADLTLYLRQFAGLSSEDARNPLLEDVDINNLSIRTDSGTYAVPFTPPLQDWSQRRERLIEMTRAAQNALGETPAGNTRSHDSSRTGVGNGASTSTNPNGIVITRYTYSRPQDIIPTIGLAFYTVSLWAVRTNRLVPGSWAWTTLESVRFPGGPEMFVYLVQMLSFIPYAIHVAEAVYMDWSRLSRFGVRRGTAVWWKWIANALFEGYPGFQRFDLLVAEAESKLGKGK